MTASVYYLPSSGHCCACSSGCWHTSPAFYCGRHTPQWQWWPETVTTTNGIHWKWASPYVGRHRKGDPEPGA